MPYNFRQLWFMSGRNCTPKQHIRIAKHELNHFMFYHYYPQLQKELGKEKYEILKEGLAIYTDPNGNNKPAVKRIENYFRKNLDKTIDKIMAKGEWEKYLL